LGGPSGRPVIGRGTWLDRVAYRLIERERKLGRSLDLLRVESGIAASGIPHIGNLSDPARAYGVALALRGLGHNSEMILFSDDMDGLRSIPAGLPQTLKDYLLMPVSRIPDPFGCHESYADHMLSKMTDVLDLMGIEYKLYRARDVYGSGLLSDTINEVLRNSQRIGEMIKSMTGQEKFLSELLYYPVCKGCGRIYTARAVEYDEGRRAVRYVCKGIEVKKIMHEGCGYEGWSYVGDGDGKLPWKVEFAARWRLLDIRFEAFGKDLIDSVRVNDWVSRNILGYEPPMHVKYEHFIDVGGKKFSKSAGNVFSPQEWLRYAPPQTLLLLIFKRSVGARVVSPRLIPRLYDELERLEDVYFGRVRVGDERLRAKLRGLYEYIHLLRPPQKPRAHAPFRLLADIVSIAPQDQLKEFTIRRLQKYGIPYDEYLLDKAERVRRYLEDFGELSPVAVAVELSEAERQAIEEIVGVAEGARDGEEVQSAIFDAARRRGIDPPELFKKIYLLLLDRPHGPRLGPYLFDVGPQRLREALLRLSSRSHAQN
jgi:lysyl-tRNA synthetase class 1